MENKETLEEAKLRQLFKNRSNCYADTEDVVQAMDEDCFIKTINEWRQERIPNEIDQKWDEYRNTTNNEDAWSFKQWLVEKFKNK
jgi:hypothetical protein